MSQTDTEFRALMDRVRAGCPDATRELFDIYRDHILIIIRRRLSGRLRTLYDSEDFVQDVWASFYAVPVEAYRFDTAAQLFSYLGELAVNKVVERYRQRYGTQEHDLERVRSLDGSAAVPAAQQIGPDPTPSHVIGNREQLDRLMEGKSGSFQRLLMLVALDYTYEEIADELGLSARTVQRLVERLKNRLPTEESA